MNRQRALLSFGCTLVLVSGSVFASAVAQAQEKKPNIVFILVDNVGWGSFGVYGGTTPTPRIDQLANSGIRFNNYNVEVQCTPTRSAIHTGRYSVRSGTYSPLARARPRRDVALGIHDR